MSIRICNPKYFIMYLCVGLEILILNTIGIANPIERRTDGNEHQDLQSEIV